MSFVLKRPCRQHVDVYIYLFATSTFVYEFIVPLHLFMTSDVITRLF